MLLRVEGIVIRSMDYGESHKIISIYSRHHGKMSVMVHGAKKMNSRFASLTQLFAHGDYVIYKSGSMGTLSQGELLHSHHKLREDLHDAAYSAYLAELTDRLMPEHEGDEVIFAQLLASFESIEYGKDAEIILHVMEMKMLAVAGYLPQLDACAGCGKEVGKQGIRLSVAQGGVLCPSCVFKDPQAFYLTLPVWKILKLFQQIDLRNLGTITLKEATKTQLKQVMRSFMDTYIDVHLKSRGFLDQMEKYKI